MRLSGRVSGVLTGPAMALLLGGCAAISIPMGGLFDSDSAKDAEIVTGSIAAPAASSVPDADWRFAKGALTLALSRTDPGASVPWENPASGARGTITPLAAAAPATAGVSCRSFLLSHIRGDTESWHQGEACNAGKGGWQMRSVRPLNKPS